MTRDAAAFWPDNVHAVYGERPRCFLTCVWQWVDPHHILGRGYDLGFRRDEGRAAFSSVFNFAPIQRDIHKGPQRDSREMRHLFLRLARERVREAISDGRYVMRPEDDSFLLIAEDWLSKNPV